MVLLATPSALLHALRAIGASARARGLGFAVLVLALGETLLALAVLVFGAVACAGLAGGGSTALGSPPSEVVACDCTTAVGDVPILGLHAARREATDGYVPRTWRDGAATVYLDPTPLIALSDVEAATAVRHDGERTVLSVRLTEGGGVRVRAHTEGAGAGQPLAIVIGGDVVQAATVVAPFGRDFVVAGGLTTEQACLVHCALVARAAVAAQP